MPVVTETPVNGLAWCPLPMCRGSRQVPARLVQRTTSFSYRDHGGDLPGEESSKTEWVFADAADLECPHCSTAELPRYRECGIQKRPEYEAISGFDPNGLLAIEPEVDIPGPPPPDDQIAELRAQVDQLTEQLTAAIAAIGLANGSGHDEAPNKPARKRAARNGHDG